MKKEYFNVHDVVAVYADTAFTGVQIHGIEYEYGYYYVYAVRVNPNGNTLHRVLMDDAKNTFRINGMRYNVNDFIRV